MSRFLCLCGCGHPTPLYNVTDSRFGAVKGQPMRFIRGHNMRVQPKQEDILMDVARVIQDTVSADHPKGDIRRSTYFKKGRGRYTKEAFYRVFNQWSDVIKILQASAIRDAREKSLAVPLKPIEYKHKKRTCLQCDKTFLSWGAANRKCQRCRQSETYLYGGEDPVHEIQLPKTMGGLT